MFVHAASILNIDTLWSSEIDKACEAVTSEHCPSTTQLGNILDINGAQIAPVDIIIGEAHAKTYQ